MPHGHKEDHAMSCHRFASESTFKGNLHCCRKLMLNHKAIILVKSGERVLMYQNFPGHHHFKFL